MLGHCGRNLRHSRKVFAVWQPSQTTRYSASSTKSASYGVWEFPASNNSDENDHGVLYQPGGEKATEWKPQTKATDEILDFMTLSRQAVSHFLPAQYPNSVAPGYFYFTVYSFIAGIAGSASMVLSTQTLLLAVGVIGSNAQNAGIMAGALNWVMKDFVGQLGGVLFASQMGKTRAFDADPKYVLSTESDAKEGSASVDTLTLLSRLLSPIIGDGGWSPQSHLMGPLS
jgi:hypothetical protein